MRGLKKSEETGETKGGIQLIKLKKKDQTRNDINVELEVRFEDRNGNKYRNTKNVSFSPPKEKILNNDMIEDDDDNKLMKRNNITFYDNLGIRNAILLCKYEILFMRYC